jgi:hypothetical protein
VAKKTGSPNDVQKPTRQPNDGYLASKPSNIDGKRVWIGADSFIAAAEFIRRADGKLPPKF